MAGRNHDPAATPDGTQVRAEVLLRGEVNWASSALRFGTRDNALKYARDLAARWVAVMKWRAVPVTTPERERYQDGTAEVGSWREAPERSTGDRHDHRDIEGGPGMTTPYAQLPPLRVRPEVRAALEEIAQSDGRTLSYVVMLAVAEFLARNPDRKLSGNATDRAALVESVRR